MTPSVRTGEHNGIPSLCFSGEFDFATGGDIRSAFTQFATVGEWLLLDLKEVTFLDSTPLGQFVSLHFELVRRGGAVAIASLQPQVHRVFELAGLLMYLNVFEDADQAVEFLYGLRENTVGT